LEVLPLDRSSSADNQAKVNATIVQDQVLAKLKDLRDFRGNIEMRWNLGTLLLKTCNIQLGGYGNLSKFANFLAHWSPAVSEEYV